jgi:hypothetical protein
MKSSRGLSGLLSRLRTPILAAWLASVIGFLVFVSDNYIIHNPYAFGRSCVVCYNYVYYVYDFAYRYAYPGLFAAAFFVVSLVCLVLLWTPSRGLPVAMLRTFLVVAPALVLAFEAGVYFWLNYAWKVHATDFLERTPFTNEVVFWTSGGVLVLGVVVELARRR